VSETKNRADGLSRRFIALFTAGEREEWLRMLSPDQVTTDRRPLVGIDTTGIDELAEAYPRDRNTRALSSTVETIAVRGDAFALVRWCATSGSGREWDSLHLTRWNADGLNVQNIVFPSDQLGQALVELDDLYQESLGNSAGTAHRRR
jgi:hypothetical protein